MKRVVSLTEADARDYLAKNPPSTDVDPLGSNHEIRTCAFAMSVLLANPSEWALDWARFRFSTPSPPTSVASYMPQVDGISLKAQQGGSVSVSPSFTVAPTGGTSVTVGPIFTSQKTWQGNYTTSVDTLKGFMGMFTAGLIELIWEMTADKAVQAVGGSQGHAVVATAVTIFQFPRGSPVPEIKVDFEGQARRPKGVTFRPGYIEAPSLGTFSLDP